MECKMQITGSSSTAQPTRVAAEFSLATTPATEVEIPASVSETALFRGITQYDIERQYLKNNPDVAEAVKAGTFRNAHEHFLKHGQAEGRDFGPEIVAQQTAATAIYLRANPDVLDAIRAGGFKSAREHFEMFGAAEGRTWNEPTLEAVRAHRSPPARPSPPARD
jgi:hypothetical protein